MAFSCSPVRVVDTLQVPRYCLRFVSFRAEKSTFQIPGGNKSVQSTLSVLVPSLNRARRAGCHGHKRESA